MVSTSRATKRDCYWSCWNYSWSFLSPSVVTSSFIIFWYLLRWSRSLFRLSAMRCICSVVSCETTLSCARLFLLCLLTLLSPDRIFFEARAVEDWLRGRSSAAPSCSFYHWLRSNLVTCSTTWFYAAARPLLPLPFDKVFCTINFNRSFGLFVLSINCLLLFYFEVALNCDLSFDTRAWCSGAS